MVSQTPSQIIFGLADAEAAGLGKTLARVVESLKHPVVSVTVNVNVVGLQILAVPLIVFPGVAGGLGVQL